LGGGDDLFAAEGTDEILGGELALLGVAGKTGGDEVGRSAVATVADGNHVIKSPGGGGDVVKLRTPPRSTGRVFPTTTSGRSGRERRAPARPM